MHECIQLTAGQSALCMCAAAGHQSYITTIRCPSSGTVLNTATLLAGTGQRLTDTASVLKNCYDLSVRLGAISPPSVAKCVHAVQQCACLHVPCIC